MPESHSRLLPRVASWKSRGQLVELNGHQIFVIDEGSNNLPVLLLPHGYPTSSFDFLPIWESLAEHYRLVTLDMLGFGFSDKPNRRDYSIHKQADLFDELLKQLGIEEFHILCHDYGVSVSQELLARQQDGSGVGKCLSCCFLNGGLFPETHRALLIQKIMLSRLGPIVNKVAGFSSFARSFSKVFGASTQPSDAELREFWQLININEGRHLFHNVITYMLDRREHRERWVQALKEPGIPIGLINGSVDPVSGSHLVARYRELGLRLDYLKELPSIGHYPQVEAPTQVAKSALDFFRSV